MQEVVRSPPVVFSSSRGTQAAPRSLPPVDAELVLGRVPLIPFSKGTSNGCFEASVGEGKKGVELPCLPLLLTFFAIHLQPRLQPLPIVVQKTSPSSYEFSRFSLINVPDSMFF